MSRPRCTLRAMAKYARQRRRSAALRDLFGPEAVPAKLKMPRVPPLSPRSSKTASTNVPGGSLSNSLHLFLETSRASDFNQPSPLGPASPVIEAFDALIVQPSADSKAPKRVPPLSHARIGRSAIAYLPQESPVAMLCHRRKRPCPGATAQSSCGLATRIPMELRHFTDDPWILEKIASVPGVKKGNVASSRNPTFPDMGEQPGEALCGVNRA